MEEYTRCAARVADHVHQVEAEVRAVGEAEQRDHARARAQVRREARGDEGQDVRAACEAACEPAWNRRERTARVPAGAVPRRVGGDA